MTSADPASEPPGAASGGVPLQPGPGRAGRNLPAAIAVGVALGALILGSLLVVRGAFLGVVVLAALVGVWELSTALASSGVRVPLPPVTFGGVAMLVGAWAGGAELLVVILALTVLATMVWRMPAGAPGYVRDVTAGIFVTGYVPLLGAFVVLMLVPADGAMRVVTFLVAVVASDTGGYVAGILLGKHPMAPTISPKKTWEGFSGSVAGCAVAGWLTVAFALDGRSWVGVLLGVATAVTATLGDLSESLVKRDLGIKDMGRILPGHGGLMDRLDSILLVAPVAWLVLDALVPVS